MTTMNLYCRMDDCDRTTSFSDVTAAKESDWSEITSLGAYVDPSTVRRAAYCPGHSLDTNINYGDVE